MKKLVLLLTVCLLALTAQAQERTSIFGKWKTIDDDSGEVKSVVEIFEKDGKAYGRIIQLFRGPDEDQNPLCEECKKNDERYKQPIVGLEIIRDLKDDGTWKSGDILDPENGKVYDCKIWVDEGELKVRGYLYFLYRTQTWLPYN